MEYETTSSSLPTQPKGNMTNVILIVVIVCIVGIFILGIIIVLLLIRRRKHKKQNNGMETMYENSEVDDAIHAYGNMPAAENSDKTHSGTMLNDVNNMKFQTSLYNGNHINYNGSNIDDNQNRLELPPKRYRHCFDNITSNALYDENRHFGNANIAYIDDRNMVNVPRHPVLQNDQDRENKHMQDFLKEYPRIHSNNHMELQYTGRKNVHQYNEMPRRGCSFQYDQDRVLANYNTLPPHPPHVSMNRNRQSSNNALRNPVGQAPYPADVSDQINQNGFTSDSAHPNQNLIVAKTPYSAIYSGQQGSTSNYAADNELPIRRSISYPPNEVSIPYSSNDRNIQNLKPHSNLNNGQRIQNPWSNAKENPISKPEAIYAIAEINQNMKQRHNSDINDNNNKPPLYANVSSLNRPKVKTLYDDAGAQYADINTTTTGNKSRRSRSRPSSFHKESNKTTRARSHSFHKEPKSLRNRHDSFHRDYPDDHIIQKELVYASLGKKKGSNFEHIAASNEQLSTKNSRKSGDQFMYRSNKLSPEDVAELYANPLKLKKRTADYDNVQVHNMTYHPSQDRTRNRTEKPTYAELI